MKEKESLQSEHAEAFFHCSSLKRELKSCRDLNKILSDMLAVSGEKCKGLAESRDFHLLKFNELQSEVENVVSNTFHEA